MSQLNLPEYKFKIKKHDNLLKIFDTIRMKYVRLTPEEWVRQNFIQFLTVEKGYPLALIAIEKQIMINGLKKRFDALIFDRQLQPLILVEFKAPDVQIDQSVFDQAAVYNSKLGLQYYIISNGMQHFFCKLDVAKSRYLIDNEIPSFQYIENQQTV